MSRGCHYTKDIGTFEVETAKFKAQFKGNVDLGVFCLVFLIITLSNKNEQPSGVKLTPLQLTRNPLPSERR